MLCIYSSNGPSSQEREAITLTKLSESSASAFCEVSGMLNVMNAHTSYGVVFSQQPAGSFVGNQTTNISDDTIPMRYLPSRFHATYSLYICLAQLLLRMKFLLTLHERVTKEQTTYKELYISHPHFQVLYAASDGDDSKRVEAVNQCLMSRAMS